MTETKFKDLSGWLKFAAIGGFISMISYAIAFLVGFAEALW